MRRIVVLLAFLGLCSRAGIARAADPALEAAILRDLDTAARKYAGARMRWRATCGKCGGKGSVTEIVVGQGGGQRTYPCRACEQRGWLIGREAYRTIHWDLKSPAFRAQPGGSKRVEDGYVAEHRAGVPVNPTTYKVSATRMLGERRGEADIAFGAREPIATRWVRVEEKPGRLQWFLWDAATDGAWPVLPAPPAAPNPNGADPFALPAPEPAQLTDAEHANVKSSLASATSLGHTFVSAGKIKSVLFLRMAVKPPVPGGVNLVERAVPDLRLSGRVIWGSAVAEAWTEIRWVFLAKYRDRFGGIVWLPYLEASITREDFARIVWDNLNDDERLVLFDPRQPSHDGFTLWRQK